MRAWAMFFGGTLVQKLSVTQLEQCFGEGWHLFVRRMVAKPAVIEITGTVRLQMFQSGVPRPDTSGIQEPPTAPNFALRLKTVDTLLNLSWNLRIMCSMTRT